MREKVLGMLDYCGLSEESYTRKKERKEIEIRTR